MPRPFSRTVGLLDHEGRRFRVLFTIGATLLLAAWTVWFFKSSVTVFAVSHEARLEVDGASYPVEAPVSGRVVSTTLLMGRMVNAGDTLVQLDTRAQRLEVGEERARLTGLAPQIARLNAEIAEQQAGRHDERAASAAAIAEAQSRYKEATESADLAADNERRFAKLAAEGLIGEAELVRAQSEAKQRLTAAETLRLAFQRIETDQQREDTKRRIEIERLERQAAELRGQVGTGTAAVERLEHDGDMRRITAPVSGMLAEVSTLRVGAVLQPGETIATIIPAGALHIVAGFLPADAFGRVQPGQPARLRLDAFPFTQYGSIPATVATVANELRDGRVRVELDLSPGTTAIPMQHGLPGTIEIEVERISPAALVLRATGQRVTRVQATAETAPRP